jgi:hypothetical protein
MASTVSAVYALQATVTETFTGEYVSSGDNTITINGLNETGTLNASSSVPATKVASGQLTMTAGAATLDLTALVNTASAGQTVTHTGLKPQIMILRNLSTNANNMTVGKGASNGWSPVAAGTTWSLPLAPAQSHMFLLKDLAIDVAAGAKDIDVAGTGSQILEWTIVSG